MALRCSLLGHDYGDSEVEREREERGSEVVVTVQEYEECARCGDRNVISENTEVTSLFAGTDADSVPDEPDTEPPEPPLESDATDTPDAASASGPEVADPADTVASPDGDDAELIDADDAGSDASETGVPGTEPSASPTADPSDPNPGTATAGTAGGLEADDDTAEIDLPTDEHGEPVTDDGEILEDEPATDRDRDRDHGEWPDSDDVGPPVDGESDPTNWPDDPADGGTVSDTDAPEPDEIDDDAVLLDTDDPVGGVQAGGETGADGSTAAATDARSVTADPPTDVRGDAEPAPDPDPGTGIERAASAPTPAESDGASDDIPTELYCPRCDYVSAGDRESLRTGDICPDCRKGYLSERERR
ncbi:DUF7093 family protein [Natrinema altunense]|uniref:Uncharacterized protein n=1 Tax=Natrinema altunense TaxID=222984 RepID=A0A482Y9X0_9EURY|nr:hypothetical protein [Natrinema altunense]RZH69567.1 hypothetical protein ELS17_09200 [Natrinema altunense]